MKIKVIMMGLVLACFTSFASADFSEMEKALKEYRSNYYEQTLTESRDVPQAALKDEDGFNREVINIEEQRKRWEQSVNDSDSRQSFYRPDESLLNELNAYQTDNNLSFDILNKRFNLESLETLTLLLNPQIKSSEESFRAAIESFSYVSNLDQILRQYTAYTEGVMPGVGPMKGKDPVKMKFPFPGVLSLKGQIAVQNVSAAREDLEISRRNAITEARRTYWNLLFIEKAMTITEKTVQLLTRLENVAVTRYEAGKTSYQDVVKVRIKRKTLSEDLITLKEKQKNLKVKVRELLNLGPEISIGQSKKATPSRNIPELNTLYPIAYNSRQELRRLRFKIGKMERMIEMSETMVLPAYTLNLSLYDDEAITQVGSFAMRPSFSTTITSSTGAGLPKMPWFGTQDAYLRQTRKKLQALKQKLITMEAATRTLVRNRWFALDLAAREESLYRKTIVDLSQSALDVSTRGYESGKVTFSDVIASYTLWLKSNLTLERKHSDLGIAWADLEQALGTRVNGSSKN